MHRGHNFPGKSWECWLQRSAAHGLPTVWDTGFLTKVDILNKMNHAWLFTTVSGLLQWESISGTAYATALSACSKEPWSRRGGGITRGNVAPTSQSRKNQSHKQRRTPKVALKPQSRWMRAATPAAVGSLTVVSTGQPEMWRRGAEKHSPQMCPSRHRRNNMSAKDGHVLLVMSTRGGGKVDTMFLLSAFSHHGHNVSKWNLNTGAKTSN